MSISRSWYHWYAETDTPAERKLLLKLDLLILPYAVIAYWIKYIDQSNINNAYVAGMSEDLNFNGNELVQLQAMYTVGAVIGQLPVMFLFPIFKMNYLIPGLELGWGVFTLLQYRTESFAELMAYRFMVGIFEAGFFPGVHYVLGAWYRGDELGRRGGIFYVGQMLGTLTAGLIQSGATAHLDGVNGLAGWRWMFIIVALITIPVGLAGMFLWPGTPALPNLLILTQSDLSHATKRLATNKTDLSQSSKISNLQFFKSIFTDRKVYILTLWATFFWNAGGTSGGGYLLWLKSLHRYTTIQVNQLGSTSPALGILYVLFINFGSDLFLGRTGAIVLANTINLIAMTILAIWNVPESAKWVAFNLLYFDVAQSSVLYGWANDILRFDARERSVTLVIMNLVAQSTTAWTPLLVFKTVEGPRWLKGWSFAGTAAFLTIVFTWLVIKPLSKRQEREAALEETDQVDSFHSPPSLSEPNGLKTTGITSVRGIETV